MNKTDLNKLPKEQLINIIHALTKPARAEVKAPAAKPVKAKEPKIGNATAIEVRRETNEEMGEHLVVSAPFSFGFNQTCHLYLRDAEGKALSKFDRKANVRRVPLSAAGQLRTALNEVWAWAGRACLFDGEVIVLTPSTAPEEE